MKKVLAVVAIITLTASYSVAADVTSGALASNAVAGQSSKIFAGQNATSASTATSPVIKLSNNVKGAVNFVGVIAGPTAGTSAHYILFTQHNSGSKLFGSGDDTTNVYFKLVPATGMTAVPFVADNGDAFITPANSWTSL